MAKERRRDNSFWNDDGSFSYGRDRYVDRAGYGYRESGRAYQSRPGASASSRKEPSVLRPKTVSAAPKTPDLHPGDRVVHKAFGPGKIKKLTPMGGDALIEVAFDSGETKKLMLRIAAQHMQKESN